MTTDANMKPPPRLLDDPEVAPEVQDGLAQLASTELPFDAIAGLASLQGAIASSTQLAAAAGTTTEGSIAAGASAGASISSGVVAAGGLALLTAGAGLYLWLAPGEPKPAPEAKPRAPVASTASPESEQPEPAQPEPAAPALAPIPAPIKEEPRVRALETPLEREVAQMVRAKAMAEDRPRAALALLERLEREHPQGALSEERRGLRVIALWNAGEHARAKAERASFLARHPHSPMRERLLQLGDAP